MPCLNFCFAVVPKLARFACFRPIFFQKIGAIAFSLKNKIYLSFFKKYHLIQLNTHARACSLALYICKHWHCVPSLRDCGQEALSLVLSGYQATGLGTARRLQKLAKTLANSVLMGSQGLPCWRVVARQEQPFFKKLGFSTPNPCKGLKKSLLWLFLLVSSLKFYF